MAQTTSPIATHLSVVWSVLFHICALCLNRSTDLKAIWQIRLIARSNDI